MVDFRDMDMFRELVFTYLNPADNQTTDIAVTRLEADRKVKLLPKRYTAIDPEWAKSCIAERGIEKHRVDRLLEVKTEFDPILFIHWGDGSQLQVEGVHRYVASWIMGRKVIPFKLIPVSVWKPYIVTGMEMKLDPVKLQKSFSGIF